MDQHLKSSARAGMIVKDLIDAQIIGKQDKGWVVTERDLGSKMILKISP